MSTGRRVPIHSTALLSVAVAAPPALRFSGRYINSSGSKARLIVANRSGDLFVISDVCADPCYPNSNSTIPVTRTDLGGNVPGAFSDAVKVRVESDKEGAADHEVVGAIYGCGVGDGKARSAEAFGPHYSAIPRFSPRRSAPSPSMLTATAETGAAIVEGPEDTSPGNGEPFEPLFAYQGRAR